MQPNKGDRIINSIMAGTTIIALVVWLIISKDSYGANFFENLIMVLVMFVGSFFIGNIVTGIPIAIIYYLTTYTFEEFYEISKRKRFVIILALSLSLCIIIAIIIT